jgi:hypothetical protein
MIISIVAYVIIVQHFLHRHELPLELSSSKAVCDACKQGKKSPIGFFIEVSTHVTKAPLELILSDVWGPTQNFVSSPKFYVSFIDTSSFFTSLSLLNHKPNVYNMFNQ